MTFPSYLVQKLSEVSGNAFFSCSACRKPVCAFFSWNSRETVQADVTDLQSNWLRTFEEAGYSIQKVWPKALASEAPDDVPAHVVRNFLQAEDARKRKHNEAAGMAYRRALELTLKDVGPDLKGTLQKRIDKLAEIQRLTPDLAQWAHSVRELGNEAAHDEPEPSEEDVDDLAAFTRILLEYLYTMPAKVRKRSPETNSGSDPIEQTE